ncbi:MAG: thioredoxin domain-containing protein [Clostridia bacterium]|nr:thioredoxin domain-containing protein [Clostridia bacterium]
MPNLLINENSPYLLQHADNPINWYPWGNEALNKAVIEDKPIFLSIGYSTCHFCHKMAKEAFSDEEIAKFLNENFVSIKVDREERPDIDAIYMDAAVRMTENAGWPLNIFLTPEGKPFFAGTYYPDKKEEGSIDFLTLLKAILKNWKENKKAIYESADEVVKKMEYVPKDLEKVTDDTVANAIWIMKSIFDDKYGGFGGAPKFPIAHQIFFLLRYWYLYKEEYVLYMVEKTLDNIAEGEIYDKENGGFYRYATTQDWKSPHYEKMLYTNALMILAFTECYKVMKKIKYKDVIEESLDYIKKRLLSIEGGFYSAEDSEIQKDDKDSQEVFIDKKIATNLNGMAILCFAYAGKTFNNEDYIKIATKCADFILETLNEKHLKAYYINGNIVGDAYAIDYVYMIWGLIELYEAGYNNKYLVKAKELNDELLENFWDDNGLYLYSKAGEQLIVNIKETYDGAIPSVNSVAIMNFMKLSRLFGEYELAEKAEKILSSFGSDINKSPVDYLYHLCGYLYSKTPKEIIISESKEEILDKINSEFRPFTLEILDSSI